MKKILLLIIIISILLISCTIQQEQSLSIKTVSPLKNRTNQSVHEIANDSQQFSEINNLTGFTQTHLKNYSICKYRLMNDAQSNNEYAYREFLLCNMREALKETKDIRICSLPELSSYYDYKSECIKEYTIQTDNLELCFSTVGNIIKTEPFFKTVVDFKEGVWTSERDYILVNKASDYPDFEKYWERFNCIKRTALIKPEINLCNHTLNKEACYAYVHAGLAIKNNDSSYCDKFYDVCYKELDQPNNVCRKWVERCKGEVETYNFYNFIPTTEEDCAKRGGYGKCYARLAIYRNDSFYCSKINTEYDYLKRTNCYLTLEYPIKTAVDCAIVYNSTLCVYGDFWLNNNCQYPARNEDRLSQWGLARLRCFYDILKETKDIKVCDYFNHDFCYAYIAAQYNKPELCRENDQEYCKGFFPCVNQIHFYNSTYDKEKEYCCKYIYFKSYYDINLC